MSDSPKPKPPVAAPTPQPEPGKYDAHSLHDINVNIRRHKAVKDQIDALNAEHNAQVSRMKAHLDTVTKPLEEELASIETSTAEYLKKHRQFLIRNNGKVIQLNDGVVAFRVVGKHLITPRNVNGAIAFLLKRRGGKRYLSVKYTLDRDAVAQADSGLLRQLAPFGFRVGRTEVTSIKPTGYKDL